MYCRKCGKEIADDSAFCSYCGVNTAGEVQPAQRKKAISPLTAVLLVLLIAAVAVIVLLALKPDAVPAPKEAVPASVELVTPEPTPEPTPQPTPEPTPEPTPTPIPAFSADPAAISKAAESVVRLDCYDKNGELYATGSGFAMFEDGVIVTNYHVIADEVYSVSVQRDDGMSFEINSVLAFDEEKDIAILKTDAITKMTLLETGSSKDIIRGEKVVAIGSPLGLLNSISDGVFSGFAEDGGQNYIQFSAAISHGSSGGPLFDDKGRVIGITSASYEEGQNVNLAVPIEEVVNIWESKDASRAEMLTEWYEGFDHTYSVDYVLAHAEELVGHEITVEGYVSYIVSDENQCYFGIVANDIDVLNVALEENSSGFGFEKFYEREMIREQERAGIAICAHLISINPDVTIIKPTIGECLIVTGTVTYDRDLGRYELINCENDAVSKAVRGEETRPKNNVYTVDYVFAHAEELIGHEITVEGYVSYTVCDENKFYFGIVANGADVLNIARGEQSNSSYEDWLANHPEMIDKQEKTGISICVVPEEKPFDKAALGRYLSVTGVITYNGDLGRCELTDCEIVSVEKETIIPQSTSYTVDYVIAHAEELVGQEIMVEGYVSFLENATYYQMLGLVDEESSILTEDQDVYQYEINGQIRSGEVLCVFYDYNVEGNFHSNWPNRIERSASCEYVTITGTIVERSKLGYYLRDRTTHLPETGEIGVPMTGLYFKANEYPKIIK